MHLTCAFSNRCNCTFRCIWLWWLYSRATNLLTVLIMVCCAIFNWRIFHRLASFLLSRVIMYEQHLWLNFLTTTIWWIAQKMRSSFYCYPALALPRQLIYTMTDNICLLDSCFLPTKRKSHRNSSRFGRQFDCSTAHANFSQHSICWRISPSQSRRFQNMISFNIIAFTLWSGLTFFCVENISGDFGFVENTLFFEK